MDFLGVPGQPIAAWTAPVGSNKSPVPARKIVTKSASDRGVPRPAGQTFKGLMKRFKPPPKHYPKQYTVRPYFAAGQDECQLSGSREQSLTPTMTQRGVTFSSDTKTGPSNADTQSLVVLNVSTDLDDGDDYNLELGLRPRLSPTLCPRRLRASTPVLNSREELIPPDFRRNRKLSLDTSLTSVSTAMVTDPVAQPLSSTDTWTRHSSLPNVQEVVLNPNLLTPDARSVSGFFNRDREVSDCADSPRTLTRPSTSSAILLSPPSRFIYPTPSTSSTSNREDSRPRGTLSFSSDPEFKFADEVP